MPSDPIIIGEDDDPTSKIIKLKEIESRVSSLIEKHVDIKYVASSSSLSSSSSSSAGVDKTETDQVLARFQQLLDVGGGSLADTTRTIKALKHMRLCREKGTYTQSKTFSHSQLTANFDEILDLIGKSVFLLASHGFSAIWNSIVCGLKVNIHTTAECNNVEQKKEIKILVDDHKHVDVMMISFYAADDSTGTNVLCWKKKRKEMESGLWIF